MRNWNRFAASLCVVVLCLILMASIDPGKSSAEPATPQTTQEPSPVVMIALPWDDPSIRIPPPQQFRAASAASAATAAFSINYLSAGTTDRAGATCLAWPPSAQTAFSYAASVWATMITSAVPIRIDACWANLGSPDVLGYSGSLLVRNFVGAPKVVLGTATHWRMRWQAAISILPRRTPTSPITTGSRGTLEQMDQLQRVSTILSAW